MRRPSLLKAIALTVAIATTATGCAATAGPPSAYCRTDGGSRLVATDARDCGMPVEFAASPEKARGLEKTHGGGGAAAALMFMGAMFIVFAVTVDVLILPWTVPHHECFCCTTTVVHVCYR